METLGLVTAELNHGGRDQVKLQYTTGEVDMSARQLKESIQQRSQSIGLASVSDLVATVSDLVATVAMQMQTISTPFNERKKGRYL